jgi:hypothetical protein
MSNAFVVTALLRNKPRVWPFLLVLAAAADYVANSLLGAGPIRTIGITGSAGVQVRLPFTIGRALYSPFLDLTAEHDFLGDGRMVTTTQVTTPLLPVLTPANATNHWPHDPSLPGGAWQFHSPSAGAPIPNFTMNGLIPDSPRKPIRFWFETGDQDLFYPDLGLPDGMHDWTMANEDMARVLAAKGYQYQFVFSRNAHHVDGPTELQTLPEALEWLWRGYPANAID